MSTIYLIHLDRPLKHAAHYLGFTKDDDPIDRVNAHLAGTSGSKFMAAVHAAGISGELVRTWPGDRTLERTLKEGNCSRRFCPRCVDAYREECRERMRRIRTRRSSVPA